MKELLSQGLIAGLTARREDWLSWSIQSVQVLDLNFEKGVLISARNHSSHLQLELTLKDRPNRKLSRSWSTDVPPIEALEETFAQAKKLSSTPESSKADAPISPVAQVSTTSGSLTELSSTLLRDPQLKHQVQSAEGTCRVNIINTYNYREKPQSFFELLSEEALKLRLD